MAQSFLRTDNDIVFSGESLGQRRRVRSENEDHREKHFCSDTLSKQSDIRESVGSIEQQRILQA